MRTAAALVIGNELLSGKIPEGNLFVLSYESSALIPANATTPAASISANYLCAFRTNGEKIVEAWMNGSMSTTPEAAKK